jgi:protein tyrosine/serine phosphatase
MGLLFSLLVHCHAFEDRKGLAVTKSRIMLLFSKETMMKNIMPSGHNKEGKEMGRRGHEGTFWVVGRQQHRGFLATRGTGCMAQ